MTTGDARDFALQLDREFAEMMGDVRGAVIYVATEALAKVQEKSPVDIGTFLNNWLVSIGQPDDNTTEVFGQFAAKSAGAIASYAAMDGWPVIYLQNNLPYGPKLEDGYSSQAPGGMVGLTVAELQAEFNGMSV